MEPVSQKPLQTKEDILNLAESILNLVDNEELTECSLEHLGMYTNLKNNIASIISEKMGLDFEFKNDEE